MRHRIFSFLGLLSFVLVACKDPIPDPEKAVLLTPEDNTSCLYVSHSSLTASVDFSWQEAAFTDEYKVVIKNLISQEETTSITENIRLRLTLTRGVPYQWKVITTSELSDVETPSVPFSFYLEGLQQRNYLPFPARLLSPQLDELITLNDGAHDFSWEGSDLDDDLDHYTLLVGQSIDALDEVATTITTTNYRFPLNAGQVYFWQVISHDQNGNNTASVISRFETRP
ncbi:MAG: hypothetical protein ACPG8F_02215 [Flavobacteriaceae bacterium]